MDFVSEIALRALASATTPHDAEHAAAACERRAGDIGPDSPGHASNQAAAALLRELATSAPRTPRHLTITYTGLPVRVDPTRIDPDKHVVPDHLDGDSGEAAARLLMDAVDAGAIVQPADVTIECYGDDDLDAGGFVLVAFGDCHSRRGVTCGWRDVKNISGKTPEDALAFMVAELNTALGVPTLPSGKLARVAIAAKELPVREALRQIVAGDPRSVVAGASGARVCEVANLACHDIDLLVVAAGARTGCYTVGISTSSPRRSRGRRFS